MSAYRYEAARADGALVSGVLDARSAAQASAELADRGLFPIVVRTAEGEDGRRPSASRRDLAIAFQSIAALAAAGGPLGRAGGARGQGRRGGLRRAPPPAQAGGP